MKTCSAMSCFLSLLVITSCVDISAVPDGTVISPETLKPYAAWVQQATGVDMTALPVAIASESRLRRSQGLTAMQYDSAMGAYLPGRIILDNIDWDPRSPNSQSYLVHELVHHAQLISGRIYACDAVKEREAYTLQNRWLVEHGDAPIVDEAFIDKISACPERAGDQRDASSKTRESFSRKKPPGKKPALGKKPERSGKEVPPTSMPPIFDTRIPQ